MHVSAPRPPLFARHAALILVLVTLLWSVSFPLTKSWQTAAAAGPAGELLSSLTLIGLRLPLALVVLAMWQPGLLRRPSGREHAAGAALGAVFFAGFALQTWGLAFTTPALSAFFTSLCSALVPPLAWLAFRQRVAPLTLAGLSVALVGCAVLVDGGWSIGPGEWLTAASSVLFAVQMLMLDRFGQRMPSSHFTAGFLGTGGAMGLIGAVVLAGAAGPGVGAWGAWVGEMLSQWRVAGCVVLLALLPTVLGFHWMNTFQPLVSPSTAALIYLLEPVFTSLFSIPLGHDQLTYPLVVGGLLILAGNLLPILPHLVRTWPGVPRERSPGGG